MAAVVVVVFTAKEGLLGRFTVGDLAGFGVAAERRGERGGGGVAGVWARRHTVKDIGGGRLAPDVGAWGGRDGEGVCGSHGGMAIRLSLAAGLGMG
jgi:hypothetical protein